MRMAHEKGITAKEDHEEDEALHACLKLHYPLLRELVTFYACTGSKAGARLLFSRPGGRAFCRQMQLVGASKELASGNLDMMFLKSARVDKAYSVEQEMAKRKRAKKAGRLAASGSQRRTSVSNLSNKHHQIKDIHESHESAGLSEEKVIASHRSEFLNSSNNAIGNDQKSTGSTDRALARAQFLEFFLRLCVKRYAKRKLKPAEAVEQCMQDHIIPNAFGELKGQCDHSMLFDRNRFRDEKLYYFEIDQVFRNYFVELHGVFARASHDGKNFTYKGKFLSGEHLTMPQWVKLMQPLRLADVTAREIKLAFVFCQMANSKGLAEEGMKCSFVEFLEALARLADMSMDEKTRGLNVPLSHKLSKVVEKLVDAHHDEINQYIQQLSKASKQVQKRMSASNVKWGRENTSTFWNGLVKWRSERKRRKERRSEGFASSSSLKKL